MEESKMKAIYFCLEVIATVGLIFIGSKYGTTNIWIASACIVGMHFFIEMLCHVYAKIYDNKKVSTTEKNSSIEVNPNFGKGEFVDYNKN